MSVMEEKWLPIPGWEGFYEASDLGRVRSIDRVIPYRNSIRRHRRKGKLLTFSLGKDGYRCVYLGRNSYGKSHRVHQLILLTFIGPCPPGMVCRHLDGNVANNAVENLCYGTWIEQVEDRRRHGTEPVGEKHHAAKLKNKDIPEVIACWNAGETQASLARRYGVSKATMWRVIRRMTYKCVSDLEGI